MILLLTVIGAFESEFNSGTLGVNLSSNDEVIKLLSMQYPSISIYMCFCVERKYFTAREIPLSQSTKNLITQ